MSEKRLVFKEGPAEPGRKTKMWSVRTVELNRYLGWVHWHTPWRRYVFEPAQSTIFDAGCLLEIVEFLKEVTLGQKKGWGKPGRKP